MRSDARGWPLSVPLQVAELEAMAAAARRAGRHALVTGVVLAVTALAAARLVPAAGAFVVVVSGERLARAARHRRAARRVEIGALTRSLDAGHPGPAEPWPVLGAP